MSASEINPVDLQEMRETAAERLAGGEELSAVVSRLEGEYSPYDRDVIREVVEGFVFDDPTFKAEVAAAKPTDQSASIAFVPSDELLRDLPTDPDWLWEGALVRGAVTLLAGPPKVSKSTITYALGADLVDGAETFLGRRLFHAGPVVYASEEGRSTLGVTFPRRSDIYLLTRDTAFPKPTWQELVAAAASKAREVGAALVVLDTFSFWNSLSGDQEKDSGHVQPLVDALVEITATGAAVLLVHHHRKAAGEDGERIRGSSAIAGAVDAYLEVERIKEASSNHRSLTVTSRWLIPPVLVVSWTPEDGHRVVGEVEDRADAAKMAWETKILDALPREGEGATLDELEALLGADKRKWNGAFQKLIDAEQIERSGGGKKGDPYRHRIPSRIPSRGEDGIAGDRSVSNSVLSRGKDGIETNPHCESIHSVPRQDGNDCPTCRRLTERAGEPIRCHHHTSSDT